MDGNAGRLARWLRALGYDAACERGASDGQLVRRAAAEGRVLLTRDAGIMRRRPVTDGSVRALWLADDRWPEQLRQVVSELGLELSGPGPGRPARCLECNLELSSRTKAEVWERLPPRVRLGQERFWECPGCGRLYWQGTHWKRMRERVASL